MTVVVAGLPLPPPFGLGGLPLPAPFGLGGLPLPPPSGLVELVVGGLGFLPLSPGTFFATNGGFGLSSPPIRPDNSQRTRRLAQAAIAPTTTLLRDEPAPCFFTVLFSRRVALGASEPAVVPCIISSRVTATLAVAAVFLSGRLGGGPCCPGAGALAAAWGCPVRANSARGSPCGGGRMVARD